MPLLLVLVGLLLPRVLIAYVWFTSAWFQDVFHGLLWPILGFLFAPVTLLWYSVVVNVYQGQWDTLQIVVLVIAVLIDFSPSARKRKRKES